MDYLLDTDICIAFLKNKFNVADKIESVGIKNCYISEITVIELTYGAYHSSNFEKHTKEVMEIQALFESIPIYTATDEFARTKSKMRKQGILIPDFDLLIGTSAIANKMTMVTKNVRHFSKIENLTVENWSDKNHNEFIA